MDIALAQLALVFLPGLIWANIDAKYGAGLKPDHIILVIRSVLFGLTTYSILFLIYLPLGKVFGYSELSSDFQKIDIFQLKDEIAWSIPLSLCLAILWLWAVRFRLLKRLLHAIGASRRYGDEDVWTYTFNSSQADVEYVHFRDLDNGYVFAGWVNTFSESEDYRELLLRDVIVYDSEGTEISQAPHLYISRPKSNIWIEFPYTAKRGQNVRAEAAHSSNNH